jgi:two-component system, NtrC family, sensor kinase
VTEAAQNPHDSCPSPDACCRALMDSLSSCTAILSDLGIIHSVNGVWSGFEGGNPFVQGQGPGADYRQLCLSLVASADGNVSIVALGLMEVLKGKIPRLSLDYPCSIGGVTRWFGATASRITLDPPLIVVHHQDITERMEVRRQLYRIEHLFKATTENALDLITILDTHGKATYNSPSYSKVLGYGPRDWVDRSYTERVHEEDRATFIDSMRTGFKMGLSPLFEYRFAHKDGSYRYLEGRVAVIENAPGDRDNVLLISRDITARKEAEAQRSSMEVQLRHAQKLEAIGQLAAGIAHEINTPVQYISDNLRFLDDAFHDLEEVFNKEGAFVQKALVDSFLSSEAQSLSEWVEAKDASYLLEEVPKALLQSKEGVKRVATIIQAMKVFSHPGTEGKSAIDLNQSIENTLLVARNEWKYIAEMETEFDPAMPKVECYAGEINQVFLNLVVNAAHAIQDVVGSSGGKGTIRVRTQALGDWAEIRVSDTGTGIPEEIRPRIFLPFFTTKAVGKGTGQGLAIVHSVVTKHGGTVDFETESGKGTTFIVRIPVKGSRAE